MAIAADQIHDDNKLLGEIVKRVQPLTFTE